MTVIAFKDGVMAADTQLTGFNQRSRAQKLVRLPDGGVAGGCGDWSRAYAGLKFLAEGGNEENDKLPNIKDATILIAKSDGTLWLIEDEFPAFPLLDSTAAIGCGVDAAMMAMSYGATAVEACQRVAKQDVFCGDPVQSMEVEPTHEYGEAVTHKAKRR